MLIVSLVALLEGCIVFFGGGIVLKASANTGAWLPTVLNVWSGIAIAVIMIVAGIVGMAFRRKMIVPRIMGLILTTITMIVVMAGFESWTALIIPAAYTIVALVSKGKSKKETAE